MKPLIKVEDLSVIYNLGKVNEFPALKDINLEIYSGEYVAFFGPSGCGKSTLLYCAAGLQKPTRGKVIVADKNLSEMTERERVIYRRLEVSLIFQNFNLIPTLNVLDNVLLPNIFGGLIPGVSVEKAKGLLKKFGILNLMERYPSELSGGQQQRVAIARALIYNSPILLVDEPTGNLDSVSAKTVMDVLYKLNEKYKKTVILVTHEPFWLSYPHRIFHMKDGEIIRETINKKRVQIKEVEELRVGMGKEIKEKKRRKPIKKMRHLIYYLLSSFDEPIIRRLERVIRKRMEGKIDREKLKEILDKPFEKGGVGLYKQTAESLTEKIERILNEIEIEKEEKEEEEEKIIRLRKFLLEGWRGNFHSFEQLKRFDLAIKNRIEGKIDKNEFQRILDLPFKKEGVGLNKRSARNFAKKLELILKT